MKFRNPWIDPRVSQVRSAAAQAYLSRKGWKPLAPDQPNLLPFDGPFEGDPNPLVHVPIREQARDYTQRIIELITEVALAEGRYAAEVLSEILDQAAVASPNPNGPTTPKRAEPATQGQA
jgi:hypothetical protein